MNALVIIILPLVLLILQNVFRKLIGKFDRVEFGLDLHFSGLVMMLPLPFVSPNLAEPLLYMIVFASTCLLITSACYMICLLNPKRVLYERFELVIGAAFLVLGIGMTLCTFL